MSEKIRTFDTGANRDTAEGKLEYAGFMHPLVLKRFAEYMDFNRHLADGSVRASDNWQKGIPIEVYEQSLARHFMDVWLCIRGQDKEATEPYETALCGVLFNTMGLLLENMRLTGRLDY